MDFYVTQDQARRSTTWLVGVYLAALAGLIVVSSWVLLLLLRATGLYSVPPGTPFYTLTEGDGLLFAAVAGTILFGALVSSYVKARELSKGGQVVALSLGGRLIEPNTDDLAERRALNVVEEMAIASGMPVPEVYLLEQENAINAFAAGLTPSDAVIGLTRGAVEKLNRAQLQGVVGHEFSHILNGDMRLNIRVIMLITGIEFVGLVGRIFTQSSRSSRRYSSRRSGGRGAGAVIMAGVVLRLIGWFGVLFGRLIQAAVSRQREYLADASAVQFTRNPKAVANALKVIGGESQAAYLNHSDTTQVAHLFFGQAFKSHLNVLFATHPPLERRIQTLDPQWNGEYLQPSPICPAEETEPDGESQASTFIQAVAAGDLAATEVSKVPAVSARPQSVFSEAIKEPVEAMALVLAVLMRPGGEEVSAAQLQRHEPSRWLEGKDLPGLGAALDGVIGKLKRVPGEAQLPLIELAMPALKRLSESQYRSFKTVMQAVIDRDRQADVFEQTVWRLVTRFLDVHFGLASPYKVRYRQLRAVALEVHLLISMLAHYGQAGKSQEAVEGAYRAGMRTVGLKPLALADMNSYSETDFNRVTEKLAYASGSIKRKLLDGLLACAGHDGELVEVERELIMAIAATMDAPIPRFTL